MTREEEIKQVLEEIQLMKTDLQVQYRKLNALEQRLRELGSLPGTAFQVKNTTATTWSLENFIGLKLIQFIGIIVLVIGLSIGVKYAIDRNLISETMRIILAYLAGIILYILSLRLREKYMLFSALLFSGGMASLYFTTYAAYVYYNMFSFAIAFVIMMALTVYTVYEAIRYNRQEIALLGLIGAYGIPFLISKNTDRPDLFFLYITLINLGVVYLTIRQAWKNTGRVAMYISWLIFIAWAYARFKPEQEVTGLVYMAIFYLLFLFTTMSPRLLKQQPLTINEGYQLVMNNIALYVSALAIYGAVNIDSNLSTITFAMAAFTGVQSLVIYYYWKEEHMAVQLLSTLSLVFFVLFIWFNWAGFTVTLLWLLTAVLVFTFGFRARSMRARMMAIVLTGVTLGKLILLDSISFTTVQKVIAYLILGILLLIASFFYQKFKHQIFGRKEN